MTIKFETGKTYSTADDRLTVQSAYTVTRRTEKTVWVEKSQKIREGSLKELMEPEQFKCKIHMRYGGSVETITPDEWMIRADAVV